MNPFKIWLLAIRPKTLWAAISPVMIGSAMAFADGEFHALYAGLALLAAVLIQIGTNLANDYFDFKKGADTAERIGPVRVTQAGLVKPQTMKRAVIIVFLLVALISIFLFFRGGWPIAVIAVFSILSGIFYTAGPFPLGYAGLGDLFVFIFFGPVAVGGTYYIQTLDINPLVLIAGLAPGLLSMAILTVNNIRDLESDRSAGKKTLAVRFGRSLAMAEYFYAIALSSFIPVILFFVTEDYPASLLSSVILLLSYPSVKTVFIKTDGPSLNHALAATGKLLLIYSLIFAIGWML